MSFAENLLEDEYNTAIARARMLLAERDRYRDALFRMALLIEAAQAGNHHAVESIFKILDSTLSGVVK